MTETFELYFFSSWKGRKNSRNSLGVSLRLLDKVESLVDPYIEQSSGHGGGKSQWKCMDGASETTKAILSASEESGEGRYWSAGMVKPAVESYCQEDLE